MSRSSVTTWLELAGLLLLAAAVALEVALFSLPGGLAAGGAMLIAESGYIAWRGSQPRRRGVEVE